jgi:hypothetical protein
MSCRVTCPRMKRVWTGGRVSDEQATKYILVYVLLRIPSSNVVTAV